MTRSRSLLLVVGILAAAGIAVGGLITTAGRQAAETQAERFADPLAALCVSDPGTAAQVGADCPQASQVAQDGARAALDGSDGTDGDPGRGVVATRIEGDRLVVTYTDGQTVDVGRVVGPAGEQGDEGEAGPDGEPGDPGADGAAGRGIAGTEIVGGRLVVSYSDGSSSDLGRVVGANGRGVAGVTADGGRLLVTFTDGEVVDAGPLPPGPQGNPGPAGPACPPGFERMRGSLVVGGVTYGSAVVCIDPSSAQRPATGGGSGSPAPSPDPDPPSAGDGDSAVGEDDTG